METLLKAGVLAVTLIAAGFIGLKAEAAEIDRVELYCDYSLQICKDAEAELFVWGTLVEVKLVVLNVEDFPGKLKRVPTVLVYSKEGLLEAFSPENAVLIEEE